MLGLLPRVIDIVLASASALIAVALHEGDFRGLNDIETIALTFDAVLAVVLFPSFGIYRSWRGKSIYDLVWRVAFGWLMIEGIGVLLIFSIHRADALSRAWLAWWALTAIVLLTIAKGLIYATLKRLRREGYNQKAVAIVGGAYAVLLIERMAQRSDAGFYPVCVCVFDEENEEKAGHGQSNSPTLSTSTHVEPLAHHEDNTLAGVPIERNFAALAVLVKTRLIRELWLALPMSCEATIHKIVTAFKNDFVNIRFIPDVRGLTLLNHEVVDLLGVPAINLAASPIAEVRVLPKLVFDRIFALVALMVLAPLMGMIALAVKLSSPGPVLFRQKRLGIDGNAFEIYKFRSMKVHAEADGTLTQATREDTRVTPLGRFLRRTSLDELPQFINVLKGEMSVVGPRPHALEHDDAYKDLVKGYMCRYRIKPGMTGWAQIHGYRGETDRIEKMMGRVKLDLYYIQHWTFGLDLKIVAITLWKGFLGSNAY